MRIRITCLDTVCLRGRPCLLDTVRELVASAPVDAFCIAWSIPTEPNLPLLAMNPTRIEFIMSCVNFAISTTSYSAW